MIRNPEGCFQWNLSWIKLDRTSKTIPSAPSEFLEVKAGALGHVASECLGQDLNSALRPGASFHPTVFTSSHLFSPSLSIQCSFSSGQVPGPGSDSPGKDHITTQESTQAVLGLELDSGGSCIFTEQSGGSLVYHHYVILRYPTISASFSGDSIIIRNINSESVLLLANIKNRKQRPCTEEL